VIKLVAEKIASESMTGMRSASPLRLASLVPMLLLACLPAALAEYDRGSEVVLYANKARRQR